MAQRVLRHLHQHALPGRGDGVHHRLDDVREHREGMGLRAGPAALDPPDRRRHPDVAAVEVNFDGITYAKGASVLKQLVAYVGRDEFPVRRAAVLPPPRVRQHRAGRPAGPAGGELGPRPVGVGRAVAEDEPGEHAAPGVRADQRRPVRQLRDRADRRLRAPRAAQPPAGRRPLQRGAGRPHPQLTGGTRRGGRPHRGSRADRAPRRRPGAGQRRRPHLRQTAARRRSLAALRTRIGALPTPWPGRCAGPRPGT